MNLLFILIFLLLVQNGSFSEKYRVFFKDKGSNEFYRGSTLFNLAAKSLSEKSIFRRLKIFPRDSFVTIEDAPLHQPYLDQIAKTGCKILLKLKWLNYVVIEATPTQIAQIKNFKFVNQVQTIREIVPKEFTSKISNYNYPLNISKLLLNPQFTEDRYGESRNQLKMLSLDKLQTLGLLGDSVYLGILDTGFRWKQNRIFQHANVLAEFDFLNQDPNTENDELDTNIQDNHGTLVFSIISGIKNGYLFGASPFATFLLAKTEDIRKESHFEEDCFASAIEWMDSIGVDIISSSLGYFYFDSTETSYDFKDLDGRTTLVSAYTNRAKKIGITMVASAGNKGPNESTIQAPAESLGEIAIGAVNPTGDSVLKFSSRGPTFDGRIKPDFVAQGNFVVSSPPFPFDTIMYGSGTSVAAPIFAGGISLLLTAFEELGPDTILSLLRRNASRKDDPDNSWGFGLVDFYTAALDYDVIISPPISFHSNGRQRIVFKIKNKNEIESAKIYYKYEQENNFISDYLVPISWTDEYFFDLYSFSFGNLFDFYVVVKTKDGKERRKPFYVDKYYKIKIGDTTKNIFLLENSILNNQEFTFSDKVRIFPTILQNSNILYIQLLDFPTCSVNLEIINIFGEVLLRYNLANQHSNSQYEKIYLDNILDGLYFVRISTCNGFTRTLKFIKFS